MDPTVQPLTQYYFYLHFDFVLCSILPSLFSFDSHWSIVRSFLSKAFGGEEIIPNRAENETKAQVLSAVPSFDNCRMDEGTKTKILDCSTLESGINLPGGGNQGNGGVSDPPSLDPPSNPKTIKLQALIPYIPDLSSFKFDFDWESQLIPRMSAVQIDPVDPSLRDYNKSNNYIKAISSSLGTAYLPFTCVECSALGVYDYLPKAFFNDDRVRLVSGKSFLGKLGNTPHDSHSNLPCSETE